MLFDEPDPTGRAAQRTDIAGERGEIAEQSVEAVRYRDKAVLS
jgi:hypothetical protein